MNNIDNQFYFIDLFAGIGGIRIALESVGGTCAFSSEIDKPCQQMYEANFLEIPFGDIKTISPELIPDHDVLAAGFPCQAFSIIGEMLGFADTRGTLFFEIEKILYTKQPKAFILENVKNLVSHDKGRTFKVILDKLQQLGYFVHYKVLNGLDFSVPQKRERVIIVGFRSNYPFVFPESSSRPPQSLDDVLETEHTVDKKHYITDYFAAKLKTKVSIVSDYSTIWHENKSGNIGIHPYSCALRANGSHNYLLVNGKRRLTPREMLRLQGFPEDFKIIVSDAQAKKQAGNSVVIPMIEAVAQKLVYAMTKPPIVSPEQLSFLSEIEEERIIYASKTRSETSFK